MRDYDVTLCNDETAGFILFEKDDMIVSERAFKKKAKKASLESTTSLD